jgi:hypothetical protein
MIMRENIATLVETAHAIFQDSHQAEASTVN